MTIEIYPAQKSDAKLILDMIIELAVYEKAREQVLASVEDIERSLFGPGACSEALICTVNGEPAGYAVFFMSYSTWLGKNGIYLEDLYVAPKHRGAGAGKSCCGTSPSWRANGSAAAWSGACWTGTNRPSISTSASARSRRASGCAIVWKARR